MGFFKSLMGVISTDGKTGTPFIFDKNHTVYFKGNGMVKTDAAKVAGFFKCYGYFTETNQSDVQIFSREPNGPISVGFVVNAKSVSAATEIFFKSSTDGLQDLFPGRPISMHLLDSNLKELKAL